MAETNWLELWRELVTATLNPDWDELVKRYETHSHKRTERPDPLLDFILKEVSSSQSVIDIGAGNGRWTIPIARKAKNVTAVEPTKAMENLLRENVCTAGVTNIQIIAAAWEEATVQAEDITIFVLVDVRPKADYDKSHVVGAISIPIQELSNRYIELSQKSEIIVYSACT